MTYAVKELSTEVTSRRPKIDTLKIKQGDSTSSSQIPKFLQISGEQNQAQNGPYFETSKATSAVWRSLGKISEEEKIEIIQTGFRLNQEGKISLKNYYERTAEYTLFQFRGYSIKYESIRRTKLYQQLKA